VIRQRFASEISNEIVERRNESPLFATIKSPFSSIRGSVPVARSKVKWADSVHCGEDGLTR